jgi:hypothetical protein
LVAQPESIHLGGDDRQFPSPGRLCKSHEHTLAALLGDHCIYKVGMLHELVAKNPVLHFETRSTSSYRAIIITPAQTLAILKSLPSLASLAGHLRAWQRVTPHAKDSDFVFPSMRARGRKPLYASSDGLQRCVQCERQYNATQSHNQHSGEGCSV